MADGDNLGWKAQLGKLRETVLEMEKRREAERRLERERNEQALSKRLKEETAEALAAKLQDMQKRVERDARRFYPVPQLEQLLQDVAEYGDLLRFYADCMKSFPKVFTPQHKSGIPAILGDLDVLQHSLDRQLGQWREIKGAVDVLLFRPRKPADEAALVTAAKTFSDRAHKVSLSIPGDYFAREGVNFWTAELNGAAIGYLMHFPAENILVFAFSPDEKLNFNKFVRAALHKFAVSGPLAAPLAAIRVSIAFAREAKFFTDLGFVRAEIKGPGEWVYQRDMG